MKCVIQAGRPKAGKTTYTKSILAKHKGPKLIYDINKEYGYPYIPMEQFLEKALSVENHLIVFEEATIFFDTSGKNPKIKEMLVRLRHTNNFFVFNFHALAHIPLYIMSFANYINIFKTNDQWGQVERKFKDNQRIFDAFSKVNRSPNPHEHLMLEL